MHFKKLHEMQVLKAFYVKNARRLAGDLPLFFLPSRWGLLDFIIAVDSSFFSSSSSSSLSSDRSGHRWTLTAKFRSQWAPLGLNRQRPSSMGTAGPQRPNRMPDRMPDVIPERILERVPERMPNRLPKDMPERVPEDMAERSWLVGLSGPFILIK